MKKITHTIETGRSMIEMLGVLAIVGILSVGALAGYSKAMLSLKVNQHTSDIIELVQGIKEAYENEDSYDNLDKNIAYNLGLMNSDGSTKHIKDSDLIHLSGGQFGKNNVIHMSYRPEDNNALCFRFLSSRWYEKFGNDLVSVGIYSPSDYWDFFRAEDGAFPLSTDNIDLLCRAYSSSSYLTFTIK